MTICSDLADYEWLTGRDAGAVLEELAADKTPLHTAIARLRAHFTTYQTHLLMEQTELRRRATGKFTQAHQMFFTRVGLEQATDERVARYKASRFNQRAAGLSLSNGPAVLADLCCGIGGDLQALSANSTAIGIDRDPVAAHFATINTGASVHVTDIATFNLNSVSAFHIDPDRRPAGRRTTSLEWCEPNIATIDALLTQVPNAAIKLAPASEVPTDWSNRCELEWISRDRECRQQVVWHGALAEAPGQHRATILPAACHLVLSSPKGGSAPRTITGQPKLPIPIADKPRRHVFDIDPAVLAAKLKGVLAAERELSALSAGSTYLTGDKPISDPALSCFEVADVLPFRIDKLAGHFRDRNVGQIEIKKRGVDLDPEKIRRQLKLRGNNSATVLITPIAGRTTAIIANRVG